MSTTLETMLREYYQQHKVSMPDDEQRKAVEEVARPVLLGKEKTFSIIEIMQEIMPSQAHPADTHFQTVKRLAESYAQQGMINGRQLFKSKLSGYKFFWIEDED